MRRHLAASVLLSLPAGAAAFPDGAPWEAAGQDGCVQCHFDAPATENSEAVTVEGLPPAVAPGETYRLRVRLKDARMAAAGFLLSAWQGGGEAGTFVSDGPRTETSGAKARSTEAGAAPGTEGVVEWTLEWQAPDAPPAEPVVIELWANAANGDQSPFGDATHRRAWQLPVGRGDGAAESEAAPDPEANFGSPRRGPSTVSPAAARRRE